MARSLMVPNERHQNALRAMNRVLVLARSMAYERLPHEEIASVLDVVEYLPRLLADERDQAAAFRGCLEDLAARWPLFGDALEVFDRSPMSWPW
jgi:hypothetical protein